MATMTHGSAAVKPSPRGMTILRQLGNGVVVRIRTPRAVSTYTLTAVPSDYGRGFCFEKETGEAYHVHVEEDGATCECLGFLRHGHCKHLDGLLALRNRGLIH